MDLDITLLRVNLDGATLTAKAPFSHVEQTDGGDRSDEETSLSPNQNTVDDESATVENAPLAATVIGLVFLLVAAIVAKRYLSEDGADGADVEIEETVAHNDD
jgi:hypothetical protein